MKLLLGLAKFLYNLLVGDSWPLTCMVVAVMLAGVVLFSMDLLPPLAAALSMALAVVGGAAATIIAEARRDVRRRGT